MNRFAAAILIVFGPLPAIAQRLDGCPTPGAPVSVINTPSHDLVQTGLEQLGIGLTADALAAGLRDPRPEARTLSALRLAETTTHDNLVLVMGAWLAEQDECSKGGHAARCDALGTRSIL